MMKTPFFATWRGQLILVGFAGFATWDFRRLNAVSDSTKEMLKPLFLHVGLAIMVLYVLFRLSSLALEKRRRQSIEV